MSAVSSKGEVTLPLKIRKAFGINPKDKVQILIRDDEIILEPGKIWQRELQSMYWVSVNKNYFYMLDNNNRVS